MIPVRLFYRLKSMNSVFQRSGCSLAADHKRIAVGIAQTEYRIAIDVLGFHPKRGSALLDDGLAV